MKAKSLKRPRRHEEAQEHEDLAKLAELDTAADRQDFITYALPYEYGTIWDVAAWKDVRRKTSKALGNGLP